MRNRASSLLALLTLTAVGLQVALRLEARRRQRELAAGFEAMVHGPVFERRVRCQSACLTGLSREVCEETCNAALAQSPQAPFTEIWSSCLGTCVWAGEARDACARQCVAALAAGRDFHFGGGDAGALIPDAGSLSPWVAMVANEGLQRGLSPTDEVDALLFAEGSLFAADRLAVYRSTDAGAFPGHAFDPASLPALRVQALARASGRTWVATAQGLLVSDAEGAHFERVAGVEQAVSLFASGDDLWVGSEGGVQRVHGLQPGPVISLGASEVDALGRAPDGTLLAATPDGFWYSREGTHWHRASAPDPLTMGSAFAVSGREILASGEMGQLYRSRDQGRHWSAVAAQDFPHQVQALVVGPDGLLASTKSDGVFTSRDHGRTWVPLQEGLDDEASLQVRALALDGAGAPWIATLVGLRHRQGGKWLPLSPQPASPPGDAGDSP